MMRNGNGRIDQSGLPNLPGFRVDVDLRQRFHKSHLFDICNGVPVSDLRPTNVSKQQQEQLAQAALQDLSADQENSASTLNRQTNGIDNSLLPRWVQYDRKVLRFFAYYMEAIHNSAIEKERVHKCVIYYYLADHTIMISDVREVNSGILQGKFLKRQKVKSSTHEGNITFGDFKIGKNVQIYGRKFEIVDVDASTREFFKSENLNVGEKIDYPKDDYIKHLEQTEYYKQQSAQGQNDVRAYVEANLGRVSSQRLQKSKKYLANDRKVLRFWGLWDDPALYGAKKYYEINYFLADDTMEVIERKSMHSKHEMVENPPPPQNGQKGGRSQPDIVFPTLLTRRPLPKQPLPQGCVLGQSAKVSITNDINISPEKSISNSNNNDDNNNNSEDGAAKEKSQSASSSNAEKAIYTHADLRIGSYINVYGRQVLICKADQFTIDWYKSAHGYRDEDFAEIERSPEPVDGTATKDIENAPVNTAVSGFAFDNRPPPKDPAKMMKFDKCKLRFLAKFNDSLPENESRRFVVEFHLGDDTVSIFEKNVRNSGFVGGKFLERSKIRNYDKDGAWFHCEDFYLGAKLRINGFKFELIETDEQTKNIMSNNIEVFTRATPEQILKGLADKLWDRSYNQTATFRFVDADHDRLISPDELKMLCKKYGWVLNPNQLKSLFEYFDNDGSGQIDADEFFQSLHKYKLDAVGRSAL